MTNIQIISSMNQYVKTMNQNSSKINKTQLTKEEEGKLTDSALKLMSDLSAIKMRILCGEKRSKEEIKFIKSVLGFYTVAKKRMLDETIQFSFTDIIEEQNDEPENSSDSSSEEDCDTESDYKFSQADENETKEVRKIMALSMVDLLNARESRGFSINKITRDNFDTDFVHFEFVEDQDDQNSNDLNNVTDVDKTTQDIKEITTVVDNSMPDDLIISDDGIINLNDI